MPSTTETFYDVLGVPPDASREKIESAYRDRIKETHPDLSDAEDAEDETKRVIEAHEVLTDDGERAEYDRVGHAAYVGEVDSDVDGEDVSSAATAARRAGWAEGSGDAANGRSSTNPRSDPRERRHRERAARERVGEERSRRGRGRAAAESSADRDAATSTDGGTATASGGGEARRRRDFSSATTPSWNASEGYTVRKEVDEGFHPSRVFSTGESFTLLGIAFLLYPVILFSAVFPLFPLVVNVVVGLCLIFLVGYLQSMPEVGAIVFGFWSVVGPLALLALGIGATSLIGILVLTGTWLPFGLSVLTLSLVRP